MKGIRIVYSPGVSKMLEGDIQLPASKSISNRLLIIKELCNSSFEIQNISDSTDTLLLERVLSQLKQKDKSITLNIQDAGTPCRFLTAFLAIQNGGEFILMGSSRMHERPIKILVEALRSLGADIDYLGNEGCLPLRITGKEIQGGMVELDGNVSSQFISALCLIAPVLKRGLIIKVSHEIVSDSYIQMTLKILSEFNIRYSRQSGSIEIPSQKLSSRKYVVENDWSSAAFFYAMAFIYSRVSLTLSGLSRDSVQGDAAIVEIAQRFGISTFYEDEGVRIIKSEFTDYVASLTLNLSSFPDMAIPLIVACAIRYPQVSFTGLHHLQYKESDRIIALQTELKKAGISIHYRNDILSIDNTGYHAQKGIIKFQTYQDHRIAMALALFAFEGYEVILDNPACIDKSFPGYWKQLEHLGIKITEISQPETT